MAIFSVSGAQIAGMSVTVPSKTVSNRDFDLITEKERELLIKTTGIEYRRVADAGVITSDLCQIAAEKLIAQLGWEPSSISALIFVTQTPDYITPATAILLQEKLGLSKQCLAFDINLGCSGYVYGLSTMASLIANIPGGRGLLLVGDVSTACISPRDKSTTPIFSDAGSATAIEQKAGAPAMTFNLGSDGKGYEAIIIPDGGYRHPVSADSLVYQHVAAGIDRNATHLIMNGIDVFNFAVHEASTSVNQLLEYLGIERSAVGHYVFHQANLLINESIRKKLQLTPEQVPYSLKHFGNTSSATIPTTIVTQLAQAANSSPMQMVLCGFGVGLSWGSVHLHTEPFLCLPLIEA